MIAVSLPWPDRLLSPNSRSHWAAKAKATRAARFTAFMATRAEFTRPPRPPKWERVALAVTFNPPSRRRYDRDNLQSSLKAYFDGIADWLGVDDYFFEPTYAMGEPVKGGAVRVEITPL